MICCDEHAKHLRDASCPWCERDEAVRLLREARRTIVEQSGISDLMRDEDAELLNEIDAYLAKVGK